MLNVLIDFSRVLISIESNHLPIHNFVMLLWSLMDLAFKKRILKHVDKSL